MTNDSIASKNNRGENGDLDRERQLNGFTTINNDDHTRGFIYNILGSLVEARRITNELLHVN